MTPQPDLDITTAPIAEFRRKAADKRAQAAAAATSVENFPGVVARDPKAVIALRIAEALEGIASDLETNLMGTYGQTTLAAHAKPGQTRFTADQKRVSRALASAAAKRDWYVLVVRSGAERTVKDRAGEHGIEVYYPVRRELDVASAGQRAREPRTVERPLMAGYAFVELLTAGPRFDLFRAGWPADALRGSYAPIDGCMGFVGFDGPMAVGEAVIAKMREREAAGEFDLTGRSEDGRFVVPKWARRDAFIEFVDGPFRGLCGKIVKMVGKALVRVELSVLGRESDVDAPLAWVAWRGRGAY